ncbi:MAG: hypothetical protein QOD75_2191 [Blastocatellia bacterium]|jgi:peroxiredoxin|nr:hypothetical protein [Blastocatellia bacterium]
MSAVVSGSPSSPVRTKRTDGFLLLLLVASLFLNVYLGWKVRQAGKSLNGPPNTSSLSPGVKVKPFTAVGLDGTQQTISYETTNKPTVFYVVSPSCVWCERNRANFDKLTELKGNDFGFIGLSLSETGLKEYVERQHLKFPIYMQLKSETIQALGLGSTPQTIVISPEGKVLKNWTGAYIENLQPEVEAYFGIRLPGLTSGVN